MSNFRPHVKISRLASDENAKFILAEARIDLLEDLTLFNYPRNVAVGQERKTNNTLAKQVRNCGENARTARESSRRRTDNIELYVFDKVRCIGYLTRK